MLEECLKYNVQPDFYVSRVEIAVSSESVCVCCSVHLVPCAASNLSLTLGSLLSTKASMKKSLIRVFNETQAELVGFQLRCGLGFKFGLSSTDRP